MLELSDVSVAFSERSVLKNCSLALAPGEHLALMGPSGSGKTTLLRIALGLQTPDSGSVRCDFTRISAVFQEPRLLPWRSALDNVLLPLSGGREDLGKAMAWLERLEIGDSAGLYPDELSGGMQQRVSLARAMAFEPNLLILDEAFKGLDAELRERVLEVLRDAAKQTALLLATHSEEEARALDCRILYYQDGQFA